MTFNYSSTIKLLPKTFHIDLLNNCITAGLSILCQISCQSGLTTYSWSYWQGISQVNRFWKSSQYYSINMQKLLDEILIARFNYFMGTLLWINLMSRFPLDHFWGCRDILKFWGRLRPSEAEANSRIGLIFYAVSYTHLTLPTIYSV